MRTFHLNSLYNSSVLHLLLGQAGFSLYLFMLYGNYFQEGVHKAMGTVPSLNHESIIQGDGAGVPTGCHRIIAIIATASL